MRMRPPSTGVTSRADAEEQRIKGFRNFRGVNIDQAGASAIRFPAALADTVQDNPSIIGIVKDGAMTQASNELDLLHDEDYHMSVPSIRGTSITRARLSSARRRRRHDCRDRR